MSDPLQWVMMERARQDRKWGPDRDLSDQTWLTILVEEVGEAAQAMLESAPVKPEVIQVCAVALAWLESMGRRHSGNQP